MPTHDHQETLLGLLAVHRAGVSLDEALEVVRALPAGTSLGEYLVSRGLLTPESLAELEETIHGQLSASEGYPQQPD